MATQLHEFEAALVIGRRSIRAYQELGEEAKAACSEGLTGRALIGLGRIDEAEPFVQHALETARSLGPPAQVAWELCGVASIRNATGNHFAARMLYAEALDICSAAGTESVRKTALANLAETEFCAGNIEKAVELITRALEDLRYPVDTRVATLSLNNLAAYLSACDRFEEARAALLEVVRRALESDLHVVLAWSLQHLVAVAVLSIKGFQGNQTSPEIGARVLGYVEARIDALGSPREYTEQQEYDRVVAVLRDVLDTDELARHMAKGAAMAQDQAVEYALSLNDSLGIPKIATKEANVPDSR